MQKESELCSSFGISRWGGRGAALLMILICASLGMAQLDTGTISGTVTDQSGGAIPGAAITIRNVETGIARNSVTNAAGRYEALALRVGEYEVSSTLAGFQTLVRSGINLTVGRNAVVDLVLQVGEVTQTVTVTGEVSLVTTNTATVSNLVDEERIMDIPLNNRDLTQLAFLQPGVIKMPIDPDRAGAAVAGSGEKMSVAGGRATYNIFLLDGVVNSDQTGNVASVGGSYQGAETIQEFQVITNNYSAEYPTKPGAVISAVTKSGANAFHGSAFEFLRNDNLDAFKWEDKAFTSNPEKPEFKRNHFGGSFGGPILRDRTFFFMSYEGMRERQGRTGTATTISAAARTGDLGPDGPINPDTGTTDWSNRLNPEVVPYLNLYPLPGEGNTVKRDFGDGTVDVTGTLKSPVRDDFGTIKMDHQFGSLKAGFLSGTYTSSSAERQNLHFFQTGGSFIGGDESSLGVTSRKHVVSLRHTSVLSPTVLNEFSFGLTDNKTTEDIPISDLDWSRFLWIDDSKTMGNLAPGSGVSDIGFGSDASFFGIDSLVFKNNVSITLANHSIKFGAQYQRLRYPVLKEPDGANGRFDFDGLEFFLQGLPEQFDASLPAGAEVLGLTNLADPAWTLAESKFAFFFQDNWRVTPSLTLNLGLRYEPQTSLGEERDHLSSFRDTYGDTITVGGPFFENPTLRNFSPMFGAAWSPDQRTSLRGGFGIFYVPPTIVQYQYILGQLAPFLGEGGLVDNSSSGEIDFPNAFRTQPDELSGSPNYRQFEFEPNPTRFYRWSLTLEREMSNWFVSTGYTGSRATHLPVTGEINLNRWAGWPENVPTKDKQYVDGTLINPLMSRLTGTYMKGNSWYHGYTLNVMRRLTGGLQFQGAYTFSKNINQGASSVGNNTEGFAQGQRANMQWDMDHWKGRAIFDVRNQFVSNLTYDLPPTGLTGVGGAVLNGWEVNGILTLTDGHAFNVLDEDWRAQRRAFERDDDTRPNLIPGGDINPIREGNPSRYYDPNQFIPNVCRGTNRLCQPGDSDYATGFFGNLGYNTLTGPGLVNVDFSLNKRFLLGEEKALQFRAEFFNLFNRANFGLPDAEPFREVGRRVEENPTAGEITQTRTTARQIQFGLRFTF